MTQIVEEIKSLPVTQKAAIYSLLSEDEELRNYLISNNSLYEELALRDAALNRGEIKLTSRQHLTSILQNHRNGL